MQLGAVRPPLRGVDHEEDGPQQCLIDARHGTVQDVVQHHANATTLHKYACVQDGWGEKTGICQILIIKPSVDTVTFV